MPWPILIVAINFGLIAGAVWLRRGARPRNMLGRLVLVLAVLLLGSTAMSIGIGVAAMTAARGEMIDPSQRARMMGEAISGAMNCTAFSVLTLLPPTIVTLILFLRTPKAKAQQPEG
ncbi:MAG: hypothetical protein SFV15_05890 [Polyangiaceae bacterium]|nr:hypothetical protein [Polyangiaceae bacterium]